MSKRLLAFTPAALVAGVLLLSACGQTGTGTNAQSTPTNATSTGTPAKTDGVVSGGGDEELEPVECGPVEIHSVTHILVATPGPNGIVGCTEAFNVLDEYLAAPNNVGDPWNTIELPSGWTCSQDDGEFPSIDCQNEQDLGFHTKPDDTEGGGDEELTPVECGPVEVFETTYTLIADATDAGITGCTEAFNIIDEYLAAPPVPGDPFNTQKVSGGWECGTDDGEFAVINCTNDQGFAFHTEPVK
jgi:hypothetical protein